MALRRGSSRGRAAPFEGLELGASEANSPSEASDHSGTPFHAQPSRTGSTASVFDQADAANAARAFLNSLQDFHPPDSNESLGEARPPADAEFAGRGPNNVSTRQWPCSDFKLKQFLPGSVYLWACGEDIEARNDGDVWMPPEAVTAWVVLITQLLCYLVLCLVSGNQFAAGDESPSYSIVAVAVAVYLMLSIAAADLWGGWALLVERRRSGDPWFKARKAFGLGLLATFSMMVVASTRVLFYSSFENMELVIGAATVLFIADVDEKAMNVLSNFRGQWRLFWVIEAIGLSFGLALLAVKATGNDGNVDGDSKSEGCNSVFWTSECGVYNWFFVFTTHPVAATVVALMLTSWLSRPHPWVILGKFFPCGEWFWFSCLSLCRTSLACLGQIIHKVLNEYLNTPTWSIFLNVPVITYPHTLLGICTALYAACHLPELRQLDYSCSMRSTDIFRRRCLYIPMLVNVVFAAVLNTISYFMSSSSDAGPGPLLFNLFGIHLGFSAVLNTGFFAWLVFGTGLAGLPPDDNKPFHQDMKPAPLMRSMLLGWGLSAGFSAVSAWVDVVANYISVPVGISTVVIGVGWLLFRMLVGTWLWSGSREMRCIAYWVAVAWIEQVVVDCVVGWVYARVESTVT